MANNFFAKFPIIEYDIDGKGSIFTLTNIVKNVDVDEMYANTSSYYTMYEINDGDRPDIVSYKLYGTPKYYWTFFVLNNELRAGLNNAWPLSSQQIERMLEREYDPYSVISFHPGKSGTGLSGLINLIYLHDEYLPYLRLTNTSGSEQAKILKYDAALLQLIIYDIEKSDESGLADKNGFINNAHFKIIWKNPYIEGTDDWATCDSLRTEFINNTFDVYAEFDIAGTASTLNPSLYDGGEVSIAEAILNNKANYILSKQFVPAGSAYNKMSYRDAPAEYYRIVGDEKISVSAYDVLVDDSIVSPKYISNSEKEQIINDQKSKIRAVRKEIISKFANEFFTILNNG